MPCATTPFFDLHVSSSAIKSREPSLLESVGSPPFVDSRMSSASSSPSPSKGQKAAFSHHARAAAAAVKFEVPRQVVEVESIRSVLGIVVSYLPYSVAPISLIFEHEKCH
ncbi:MAG: hypothetical protein MHMPM18_001604 [Marteilia pararefringens]